ncbi:hypothetical protein AVEN_248686-1 [Araneus ventricosus]|uniref:Uncharacterized protein n=1 Tax=Araneus ventricosus TaxID=182803 RepID=A0A4Y2C016_ARAVE|nr:hypothetical protein AVEN_248686-1 [Araneus ventricosus]
MELAQVWFSAVILTSRFEATRLLFWTASDLAPSLQTSAPHQRKNIWRLTYDLVCNRPTYVGGGSSVKSGFEPGTLRSRSRHLDTRPPRLKELLKKP